MRAPNVIWTELPPGFVHESVAAAGRAILLGGGGQYVRAGEARVPPAVLELRIGAASAVVEGFWKLPASLPRDSGMEPFSLDEAGPALVSAATIEARDVGTVMIRTSPDFGGCVGGWFHPLHSDTWEFVSSASPESDIDANNHVGIGENVLTMCEAESDEFVVMHRDETLPMRSRWRPLRIALPTGWLTDREVHVSASGRWIVLKADNPARMRDGVLIYARRISGVVQIDHLEYEGFRVADVAITDDWLAIVERNQSSFRLRWRYAVKGEDRYLELGELETSLHVVGSRALLTQGHRALIVDLNEGVVTHNIQRGGEAQLGAGRLVPGFAVFAIDTKVGVATL